MPQTANPKLRRDIRWCWPLHQGIGTISNHRDTLQGFRSGYVWLRVSSARVPANTRRSPNAGLMLGQRRRRWANIKLALDKLLAFAGVALREINVDTLVWTLTRRDRHLRDRLDTLRHKDISLTDPRRISEVWTRDPYMTVVAVRRSTNATRLLFWKWLLVAWRFTTTLHSSKQKVMWRSVVWPFEVFAHKIRLRRLL